MNAEDPIQNVVPIGTNFQNLDAFDQLYGDHVQYITRTVHSILGTDEDVEDIVQHTFVIAMEKIHTLKKQSSVRFWLAGIAVNLCRRRLRKISLLRRLGIQNGTNFDVAAPDSTESRVLLAELFRIIQKLSANDRIAWTLRMIEDEEYSAIALVCGCSVSTAKRRVSSAQAIIEGALDG